LRSKGSKLPGASETDTPIPRDGHARGSPVACRVAGTSERAREAVCPRPKPFLAHADGHQNIPGGLPGDDRGKAMVCDCRPPRRCATVREPLPWKLRAMQSQPPPWNPRVVTTDRAASGQILPFRHSHPFVPLGGVVVTLQVTTSMRGRPQTAPEDAGSRAVQTSHLEPWSHHHDRRKCRPKILSSPFRCLLFAKVIPLL